MADEQPQSNKLDKNPYEPSLAPGIPTKIQAGSVLQGVLIGIGVFILLMCAGFLTFFVICLASLD